MLIIFCQPELTDKLLYYQLLDHGQDFWLFDVFWIKKIETKIQRFFFVSEPVENIFLRY